MKEVDESSCCWGTGGRGVD